MPPKLPPASEPESSRPRGVDSPRRIVVPTRHRATIRRQSTGGAPLEPFPLERGPLALSFALRGFRF